MHIVYAHPSADYNPPPCVLVLPIWLHPAVIDDMRTDPEPMPRGVRPQRPPKPSRTINQQMIDKVYDWLSRNGPIDKYEMADALGVTARTVSEVLYKNPHIFQHAGKDTRQGQRKKMLWRIVQ